MNVSTTPAKTEVEHRTSKIDGSRHPTQIENRKGRRRLSLSLPQNLVTFVATSLASPPLQKPRTHDSLGDMVYQRRLSTGAVHKCKTYRHGNEGFLIAIFADEKEVPLEVPNSVWVDNKIIVRAAINPAELSAGGVIAHSEIKTITAMKELADAMKERQKEEKAAMKILKDAEKREKRAKEKTMAAALQEANGGAKAKSKAAPKKAAPKKKKRQT